MPCLPAQHLWRFGFSHKASSKHPFHCLKPGPSSAATQDIPPQDIPPPPSSPQPEAQSNLWNVFVILQEIACVHRPNCARAYPKWSGMQVQAAISSAEKGLGVTMGAAAPEPKSSTSTSARRTSAPCVTPLVDGAQGLEGSTEMTGGLMKPCLGTKGRHTKHRLEHTQ